MRSQSAVFAGTFCFEGAGTDTSWHCHDLHQIEYAVAGTVEVETSAGRYLLPPQQAAWIPAGLDHRTRIAHSVRTVSVFFDPDMVNKPDPAIRIVGVTPVVREMIRYGTRWPIHRHAEDQQADAFFTTLVNLVTDCLENEVPLRLPVSTDPLAAAAIDYTDQNLREVTATAVCRAIGVSDRTLRRRFPEATGISWQTYLRQARLLRAMAMLAEPAPTILDVATAVGFQSLSAFSRSFSRLMGETPSGYRRRTVAGWPSYGC